MQTLFRGLWKLLSGKLFFRKRAVRKDSNFGNVIENGTCAEMGGLAASPGVSISVNAFLRHIGNEPKNDLERSIFWSSQLIGWVEAFGLSDFLFHIMEQELDSDIILNSIKRVDRGTVYSSFEQSLKIYMIEAHRVYKFGHDDFERQTNSLRCRAMVEQASKAIRCDLGFSEKLDHLIRDNQVSK